MDFDYTITTAKDFNSAVDSVQTQIEKAKFRVLHVHDIQKSLMEKGIQQESFKIIEFCNAKYASRFLRADITIGLFLPCKINVYIKDMQTYISGMRPIILSQFFPDADLGEEPKRIDTIIQNMINSAK